VNAPIAVPIAAVEPASCLTGRVAIAAGGRAWPGAESGRRLRLADTEDQASIESVSAPIDGERCVVSLAELRRLRRDDVSDAVVARLGTDVTHDTDTDGFRGRGGLPLRCGDVETSLGAARVVVVAGEVQPGRFVVDLLGHVRLDDPARWHGAGYVLVRPTADPAVGGAYPQLNGFHDPPRRTIYSDRGYARHWREPLPESLRLDLFALDESAVPTDVLSAGYLRSNGLFVSPDLADDLRCFSLSNAHWFDVVAARAGEQWHLRFLQLLSSDAIDFERSTFRIDGGVDPDARRVVHVDGPDAIEALRAELVNTPGRPALAPDSIVMADFPDLFKVPSTIDIAMSIRLLSALAGRERSGVEAFDPDYLLG
jgi:hypothetical protein